MENEIPVLRNRGIVFPAQIHISELHRAWKYGDGLFESALWYNGRMVHEKSHFSRLLAGMETLGMKFHTADFLSQFTKGLTELANVLENPEFARLRVQVWRGGGGTYAATEHMPEYLVELVPLDGDPWAAPAEQRLLPYRDIDMSGLPFTGLKSSNGLVYIMASNRATGAGFDDALLFSKGSPSESARANVFFVKDGEIRTPPLSQSLLPGTQRKNLIRVSEAIGLRIKEESVPESMWKAPDEMFLSSAIRGVISVSQLGEHIVPGRDLARRLRAALIRDRNEGMVYG